MATLPGAGAVAAAVATGVVVLSGKEVAAPLEGQLKAEMARCHEAGEPALQLVAVQVGDNAGSAIYVKQQRKLAESLGIAYELRQLPGTATEEEVLATIDALNADAAVTAIILQLPLPAALQPRSGVIAQRIASHKDAEGMTVGNLGHTLLGDAVVRPCTAAAVMAMLDHLHVELYGKEVCIVGHSDIVGKPLTLMLLQQFATTSTCHIGTSQAGHLREHVSSADIVIVATGVPGLIKGDMIKQGAIVIDVGINRVAGKTVGDCDYESCAARAGVITPVPGGVGTVTSMQLMCNVMALHRARMGRPQPPLPPVIVPERFRTAPKPSSATAGPTA